MACNQITLIKVSKQFNVTSSVYNFPMSSSVLLVLSTAFVNGKETGKHTSMQQFM